MQILKNKELDICCCVVVAGAASAAMVHSIPELKDKVLDIQYVVVVVAGAASVAMVHSIPELKVSSSEAANIGLEDQQRYVPGFTSLELESAANSG
jgi:hypothetical protein